MALAKPLEQNPYLSIKVNLGGNSYQTDVSKQQVHNKVVNPYGEKEEYEPFHDHVPPFLALPPVKPNTYRNPEPAHSSNAYPKPQPQPYRAEARESYPFHQGSKVEPAAPYPLDEEDDQADNQEE